MASTDEEKREQQIIDRGRRAGEAWANSKPVRTAPRVSLLYMAQASGVAHLRAVERRTMKAADVILFCQAFMRAAAALLDERGQTVP